MSSTTAIRDYPRRVTTRPQLPQLAGDRLFLTDGGLETVLIFREGIDLPEFAAFPLVDDASGVETLRRYYEPYLEISQAKYASGRATTQTLRATRGGRKFKVS